MREPLVTRQQRWWLGALAFGGVIVTHTIAYSLSVPDADARHATLEATGHQLWPMFVAIGLGALVAALARFATRQPGAAVAPVWSVAARLATLQAVGWIGLELAERAFLGHGVGVGFLTEVPVLVGIVVQAGVAIAAALVLIALRAAVALLLARNARPAWAHERASRFATALAVPTTRVASSAWSSRGPPFRR